MKRLFLSLALVLLLSACNINTLSKTSLQTEDVSVEYPGTAPAEIEFDVSAPGKLDVRGGGEMLIEGTITYNIVGWDPQVEVRGNRVSVNQGKDVSGSTPPGSENVWDLQLGDKMPFTLKVNAGVGTGTWELGGLPITELDLEMGVGKNQISFSSPNPEKMTRLVVEGGTATLNMWDILNANVEHLTVEGGVGRIELEFTGEALNQTLDARVKGGVGAIVIVIDENIPARVVVGKGGVGDVAATGAFEQHGDGYETPGYAGAGDNATLEIEIEVGVGSVKLNTIN